MPRVRVLYFAMLRELRGTDAENVDVPEGSTLADLYADLFPPGPEGALPVAFALNRASARGSDRVHEGDEVALLPPVGGG